MVNPSQKLPPTGLSDAQAPFASNFGDRLVVILDRFPTRAAASEVAGVGPDQLQKYVRGVAKPSLDAMARLSAASGTSLEWLATGLGRADVGNLIDEDSVAISIWETDASSGHGAYFSTNDVRGSLSFSRSWLATLARCSLEHLVVVFNRGTFNAPDINDGDAMLVDRSARRIEEDAYYLFDEGNVLLVKLTERQVGGAITLRSRTSELQPREIGKAAAENIKIFGRVRWRGGVI